VAAAKKSADLLGMSAARSLSSMSDDSPVKPKLAALVPQAAGLTGLRVLTAGDGQHC